MNFQKGTFVSFVFGGRDDVMQPNRGFSPKNPGFHPEIYRRFDGSNLIQKQ